jgi:hypothetical protein
MISSVTPSMLKVVEPNACPVECFHTQDFQLSEDSDADRLLALASCVYSQWFVLMKSIMTRERVIARAKYEADTGKKFWGELPYSKAPCVRQPLTASDLASSAAYESVVRATFGDNAADFAKERFYRAISTGDKRSFKIRFLFYKSSEGLKGTNLFDSFRKRLEDVVTEAEAAAGCTPDPSPRRLSLAEQERKRRKEMEPKQLTLFDYEKIVAEHEEKGNNGSESCGNTLYVGIDMGDGSSVSVCRDICSTDNADGRLSDDVHISQPVEASLPIRSIVSRNKKAACGEGNRADREDVDAHIVRKTKAYASCSELIEDIKSGAVTPYQTNDEVIADIKRGVITPSEAVIFLAELGKRNRCTTTIVWGDTRMRSEDIGAGPAQDDDSPSDAELDDIDEDEESNDDDNTRLPSECGFFNDKDREVDDGW